MFQENLCGHCLSSSDSWRIMHTMINIAKKQPSPSFDKGGRDRLTTWFLVFVHCLDLIFIVSFYKDSQPENRFSKHGLKSYAKFKEKSNVFCASNVEPKIEFHFELHRFQKLNFAIINQTNAKKRHGSTAGLWSDWTRPNGAFGLTSILCFEAAFSQVSVLSHNYVINVENWDSSNQFIGECLLPLDKIWYIKNGIAYTYCYVCALFSK